MHSREDLRIRDEVWIATALLHREYPERVDFETSEIEARVRKEKLVGDYRAGVRVHINVHCVANRPPNPTRVRFLLATGRSRRRLFRPMDPFGPGRVGGATAPDREDIPASYRHLLDWYRDVYAAAAPPIHDTDPILGLRGCGKELWAEEKPDAYVRRLRESWE